MQKQCDVRINQGRFIKTNNVTFSLFFMRESNGDPGFDTVRFTVRRALYFHFRNNHAVGNFLLPDIR